MAQVPRTRTPAKHAAQRRRPNRKRPAGWRPGPAVEFGGLAIGLVAGLGIALGLLPSGPAARHPPAAATAHPLAVPGAQAPDPAALDAEWAANSDRSGCANWAGGDGVSAIRLNSSQLAWFFSDTYIGPAGPTTGFSHISGFAHNAVVVQTRTGHGSAFVTVTGGGACTGPGRPGNAAPVVGDSPWLS